MGTANDQALFNGHTCRAISDAFARSNFVFNILYKKMDVGNSNCMSYVQYSVSRLYNTFEGAIHLQQVHQAAYKGLHYLHVARQA